MALHRQPAAVLGKRGEANRWLEKWPGLPVPHSIIFPPDGWTDVCLTVMDGSLMALWKLFASPGRALLPSIAVVSTPAPCATCAPAHLCGMRHRCGHHSDAGNCPGAAQTIFLSLQLLPFSPPIFDTLILLAEQSPLSLSTVRKERILQTLQGLD